jgi:hypothetical protein
MVLSLYEELQDGERTGLETHLRECEGCRQAFEEHQTFSKMLADERDSWEVPSGLLIESRRALANELDSLEDKRSWWRAPFFSVVFTPMRMLESAALIALGLASGVYISNHQPNTSPVAQDAAEVALFQIPENGRVSNLRIVNSDPSAATVEFAGDVVQPLRFTGRMEDETTKRLLFSAVQDSMNAGSRMQAVEVLAQKSSEPLVKEVLISRLLSDSSLAVRLKALEALKAFAGDSDVQSAFMQALMSDPNDGIRVAIVDTLAPYTNNEEMASSIEEATRDDDNIYVRLKGQGLVHTVGSQK